jgi:hypothetical protein
VQRGGVDRARAGGDSGGPLLERDVAGLGRASSAFDGTQPVFTQVPPTVPRSIITTERPLPRAAIATANPAAPDPMMARSYRIRTSLPNSRAGQRPIRVAPTSRAATRRSRESGTTG